ncbi:MAG: hypothetical protein EAX96_10625 [Candidatus Lokiarchaeota archaeon]|nr:hypothetical protein [Candidatus Lokiarchaeota archaeon]
MVPYESTRAKENLKCGRCEKFIAEGDMFLFDQETNEILCHFCNYEMKKKNSENKDTTKKSDIKSVSFDKKVKRLDDLIAKAVGKKEE